MHFEMSIEHLLFASTHIEHTLPQREIFITSECHTLKWNGSGCTKIWDELSLEICYFDHMVSKWGHSCPSSPLLMSHQDHHWASPLSILKDLINKRISSADSSINTRRKCTSITIMDRTNNQYVITYLCVHPPPSLQSVPEKKPMAIT